MPLRLRVVSYNIHRAIGVDRRFRPERIARILRHHDADIVLLQETTPEWEAHLEHALGDAYPYRAFHHCCGAGGLAFLSVHPFEHQKVIEPPERGWFPAWMVVVDSLIGRLQALNVYLRPPFDDDGSVVSGYFVTKDIRRAEIERYVEALDPATPAIVAGDFNENRNGMAIGFLQARGMTSALPEFEPSAATWRWRTSVGTASAQLDHIVYDERLTPVAAEVRDVGQSDHRPVLATFVLR